jgi:hypothetical protein
MRDTPERARLRRELEAHLSRIGYSVPREKTIGDFTAEVVRVHPVRSRIAYGATVLRADLKRPACHRQLMFFSQRRTRRRSSIPFFIAVSEKDRPELEALLERLGVRDGVRGGHVQIVSVAAQAAKMPKAAKSPAGEKSLAKRPARTRSASRA